MSHDVSESLLAKKEKPKSLLLNLETSQRKTNEKSVTSLPLDYSDICVHWSVTAEDVNKGDGNTALSSLLSLKVHVHICLPALVSDRTS